MSSLLLGLFAGFYAVMDFLVLSRAASEPGVVGDSTLSEAATIVVVAIAFYALGALAYSGVGIWNIVARRSTAAAPLIAAIVLASISVVLIGISLAGSLSMGRTPQIGGLTLNALIIVRAAVVLRMKKVPADRL